MHTESAKTTATCLCGSSPSSRVAVIICASWRAEKRAKQNLHSKMVEFLQKLRSHHKNTAVREVIDFLHPQHKKGFSDGLKVLRTPKLDEHNLIFRIMKKISNKKPRKL